MEARSICATSSVKCSHQYKRFGNVYRGREKRLVDGIFFLSELLSLSSSRHQGTQFFNYLKK